MSSSLLPQIQCFQQTVKNWPFPKGFKGASEYYESINRAFLEQIREIEKHKLSPSEKSCLSQTKKSVIDRLEEFPNLTSFCEKIHRIYEATCKKGDFSPEVISFFRREVGELSNKIQCRVAQEIFRAEGKQLEKQLKYKWYFSCLEKASSLRVIKWASSAGVAFFAYRYFYGAFEFPMHSSTQIALGVAKFFLYSQIMFYSCQVYRKVYNFI